MRLGDGHPLLVFNNSRDACILVYSSEDSTEKNWVDITYIIFCGFLEEFGEGVEQRDCSSQASVEEGPGHSRS